MDVHCSTCSEPWDVYHLWHEAIFETGLRAEEAKAWSSLPRQEKLSLRYRKEFRVAGWEFGQTVVNVVRCPCCPKDAKPNLDARPPRLLSKNCLARMRTGWPPHSKIIAYECGRRPSGQVPARPYRRHAKCARAPDPRRHSARNSTASGRQLG